MKTTISWRSNEPPRRVNIRPRYYLLVSTRELLPKRSWILRIGDVFNSRVAGNVENSDILGSMEFACKLAGAKVVMVMGHTACGAVKGAIDNAELGNLTSLLAKIKPAVAATTYTGERTSKNYAFVDAVARKNVEITVSDIRKDSPVLAAMESSGAIKIAGAMYNLETGVVDFFAE
jgi:carbonic anhydrase